LDKPCGEILQKNVTDGDDFLKSVGLRLADLGALQLNSPHRSFSANSLYESSQAVIRHSPELTSWKPC
jgi:hypothetical protein